MLVRVLTCGHTAPSGEDCATCGPSPAKRAESQRKRGQRSYIEVYSTQRWRVLRLKILRRDRFTCTTCGGPATQAAHITPFTSGDDPNAWDETNLAASCKSCNSREASNRYHATNKQGGVPSPASASNPRPKPVAWVS